MHNIDTHSMKKLNLTEALTFNQFYGIYPSMENGTQRNFVAIFFFLCNT